MTMVIIILSLKWGMLNPHTNLTRYYYPILRMRTLRRREVNSLNHCPPVSKDGIRQKAPASREHMAHRPFLTYTAKGHKGGKVWLAKPHWK